MRVSRPQRPQGRDSIQRSRLSVIFPQRSQCWGPRTARRSRQAAQIRSKLRDSISWPGWVRNCRRSGGIGSGGLGRLMKGPFQVADPRAHQALSCHTTGVISGLPARDIWDGSDPPRRGHASAHQPAPTVPIREAKKGGRSRPPPISPIGTAESRSEPQLQRGQQVREKCPCTSKGLFRAHAPSCPMCAPRSARNAFFQRSKPASSLSSSRTVP